MWIADAGGGTPRSAALGLRAHSNVVISPAELRAANVRMLSYMERPRGRSFLMPSEIPVDLIQIRILFNRLVEQCKQEDPNFHEKDCVSIDSYERCFQRLFLLLDDPDGFDAAHYKDARSTTASWGDFYRVHDQKKPKIQLSICERIWFTFDGSEFSMLAQIVSAIVLGTIIVSSASFILGTLPACQRQDPPRSAPEPVPAFNTIETVCLILFTLEYVVRLCTVWNVRDDIFDAEKLLEMAIGYEGTPRASKLLRTVRFVLGPANLIDLAAIVPGLVGFFLESENGGFVVLRLIRLTRIFRAFKNPAVAEPVIVISRTMTQSTKALYVLLFNLLLSILIFGSLMYLVEGQGRWNEAIQRFERPVSENGDWAESPFHSIPDTFWWAMVTATTVGYGDFYPTTGLGKAIAVVTMVFSLVIGSLPVGVVGGTFSQVWDDYKEEKKSIAAMRAQELIFITSSIQELDPSKLSNLMLIEVWDDQDGDEGTVVRPSPAKFMGEAVLQLELQMDQKISRERTLKLCGNPDLVDRAITGSIIVKYEWEPWNGGQTVDGNTSALSQMDSSSMPMGTLTVTLVSATNLVNLALRKGAQSNPYCMLLCYPLAPLDDGCLRHVIWRSPTKYEATSPRWNIEHCFDFTWHTTKDREPSSGDLHAEVPLDIKEPLHLDIKEPLPAGEAQLDELLQGLVQVTHALASVKSDLSALAGQVERLQTDLGLKDASVSNATSFSEIRQCTQVPALPTAEPQLGSQVGRETLLPNYVPS